MDTIEEASGRNNDALFQKWVFPASLADTLAERREARDRLTTLIARAQEEGLSDSVPGEIEVDIADWDFESALIALAVKETSFRRYLDLKPQLEALRADSQGAGLTPGKELDQAIEDWEFGIAAGIIGEAEDALSRYLAARERANEPRSLWERFGLLGEDPDGDLKAAAEAFNAGDYELAGDRADDAISSVDSASSNAARRVFIVTGAAAAFAIVILVIVWYSRRRELEED
jgi:hypothetical protein